MKCGQCQRADGLFVGALKTRTQILGILGHVFRMIVVVLAGRYDADRGQHALAENGYGIFLADDHLLHQQLAGIAFGQRYRGGQIAFGEHPADADA